MICMGWGLRSENHAYTVSGCEDTRVPLTYISFPISGVPSLPPVLLPQLGRARHLQEEADPRQGPPPTVRDEGKLSFFTFGLATKANS